MNSSLAPLVKVTPNHSIEVNLNIFTDGVNIKKSTFKKEVWPIWVQITDLPPILRMSRKNIVLAGLIVGSGVPEWEEIAPEIRAELLTPVDLISNTEVVLSVKFQVNLLIADLGAKSHLLNMFKFNGHFGCHFCTVRGKTIGRTHSYYPFHEEGQIREPVINDIFVDLAESLSVREVNNIVGVKGSSAFASLIRGLPLTAPTDYMHCVLLGVLPEALKLCYKSIPHSEKLEMQTIIDNLKCPREMIAYSRKIRSLDEMPQFKANEYFNWLFYISPLIFKNRLSERLYSHLTNLSFGIRLLLESSSQIKVSTAERLIYDFCREVVSMHGGNERIETINVHCLKHLPDQVRRFGPLFTFSALSFEAANRTIGDVFTGSNSECHVICRRILQKHKISLIDIKNPLLENLFHHFTNKENPDSSKFTEGTETTTAVKEARKNYPFGIIFNRQLHNQVYFDSTCFIHSKKSNCFVFYNENGREVFGEIQYFIELSKTEMFANVLIHKTLEEVGPVKGLIFQICRTEVENLVPLRKLKKFFRYTEREFNDTQQEISFAVKLCSNFEHS